MNRRPRDTGIAATGAGLVGVGLLAGLTALVPVFLGVGRLPGAVYAMTALGPVGAGLMSWPLLRPPRRRSAEPAARR